MTTPNFTINANATANDIKLGELINNLLIVLNEKEKHIIQNRFALNQSNKQTLEQIGRKFSVTRERIRQIEKNALKKLSRNAQNTNLKTLSEYAKTIIRKHAGIMTEETITSTILNSLKNISATEVSELKLTLALDPELEKISNTINYEPNWRLKTIPFQLIKEITQYAIKALNEAKDVMDPAILAQKTLEKLSDKVDPALIVGTIRIDKRVKFTEKGVGLKLWRHINPKTLRDKINFVLEREQKPLHSNNGYSIRQQDGKHPSGPQRTYQKQRFRFNRPRHLCSLKMGIQTGHGFRHNFENPGRRQNHDTRRNYQRSFETETSKNNYDLLKSEKQETFQESRERFLRVDLIIDSLFERPLLRPFSKSLSIWHH